VPIRLRQTPATYRVAAHVSFTAAISQQQKFPGSIRENRVGLFGGVEAECQSRDRDLGLASVGSLMISGEIKLGEICRLYHGNLRYGTFT
jgi:hypothetical protein